MKKCPKCNVAFADDMNFCLNDGTTLIAFVPAQETDEPETVLSKPLPKTSLKQPATVISAPQTIAGEAFSYESAVPKNNLFRYIMLAGAFLVFGTILGVGLMFISRPNQPAANTANINHPQNITANTANTAPSNLNAEISKAENVNQNTQPTPQKTASPKPTEKKPKGCFLDDSGKGEGEVRVRIDCDILDCENDNSTVAGTYASKTPVIKLGGVAKSENFTWTKIKIGGKLLWVASSKIRCN